MTGMKKAQWVLLVSTGAAIALSAMCFRTDGLLNMDPVGNLAIIVFWLSFPATWLVTALRSKRESTIGFCLLFSVYYSCGLLYWLLRQEEHDLTSSGQFSFLVPYVLLMGGPFLVVFESYLRKMVVWLYMRRAFE